MATPQKTGPTLLDLPDDLLYYLCEAISSSSTAQATFDLHRHLASDQPYLCHFTSTCHRLRNIAAPIQFRRATNAGYTLLNADPVDDFLRSLGRCEHREYIRTLDIRLGIPTWRENTIPLLQAILIQEKFPACKDLRIHVHDSTAGSLSRAIVTSFTTTTTTPPPPNSPLPSITTLHLPHLLALGLAPLFPSCKTLDLSLPPTSTPETPLIHPLLTVLAPAYPHLTTLRLPRVQSLHTGQPWTVSVPRHLYGRGAEGKAQLKLLREREREEQAAAVAETAFKEFGALEKLEMGIPGSFGAGEEMIVFVRAKGGGEVVRGRDESVIGG